MECSDKFSIIQDTREQLPLIFPADECYSEIIVAKLDTGDYAINGLQNLIAIDRKASVSELATNVFEKRFKDVIQRMSEAKYKYFIFEFDLNQVMQYPIGSNIPKRLWDKIRVNNNFLLSFIAQVQVQHGIHVLFCGDATNAAAMTLKIFKRIWANEKR